MISRKGIQILGLMVVCGLATGCQNTVRIRVQKVIGVSSVSRNSRIGRQLHQSIDNLNAIVNSCNAAQQTRRDFIGSFPASVSPPGSAPTKASMTRQLDPYNRDLTKIVDRATELRLQCESYFDATIEPRPPADPRVALSRIKRFCEGSHRILVAWPEKFKKVRGVDKMAAAGPSAELRDSPEQTVRALEQAAKEAEPKFGGFVSTDIYPINPSDPKYGEILKSASPIGAVFLAPFRSNTSLETLTEANVGVSGDSAIMLVMEHPGQVRVYQVSMDPTQITRNIGMLISKATAAAAKYMSGGVAP